MNLGKILIWLGIAGIFVSLAMFLGVFPFRSDNEEHQILQVVFAFGVFILSLIIIAAGALGVWAERSGEKDRKADDSQSDNNKAMKENFECLLRELKHSDKTDKP